MERRRLRRHAEQGQRGTPSVTAAINGHWSEEGRVHTKLNCPESLL